MLGRFPQVSPLMDNEEIGAIVFLVVFITILLITIKWHR